MSGAGAGCLFCGAAAQLVDSCVLEDKWSRSFGGDPVVALDHGWYTSPRGDRVPADHRDNAKFFRPYLRVLCDYCAHGWVEDVRWRAEPGLLALARGGAPPAGLLDAMRRWALLTAMLAEQLEGLPAAATSAQRAAVRRGDPVSPHADVWFFALAQSLPARVHLSQVALPGEGSSLLQVVSVDVAHLSALVVLPSDERAREVADRAGVDAALALEPGPAPRVDLKATPHPQPLAVQHLCAASTAGATASASG